MLLIFAQDGMGILFVSSVHRQLIRVLPAVVADDLLTPVGMLAKIGSREFCIVDPIVCEPHLDVVLGAVHLYLAKIKLKVEPDRTDIN